MKTGRMKVEKTPSELQIALDVVHRMKEDGKDFWYEWDMWRETDGTRTYRVSEQDNVEQYVYGVIAVQLFDTPGDMQNLKTMENVMSIIKKTGVRYSHSEMENDREEGEVQVRYFNLAQDLSVNKPSEEVEK